MTTLNYEVYVFVKNIQLIYFSKNTEIQRDSKVSIIKYIKFEKRVIK